MTQREIKFRAWEPLNKKMHRMNFCLYESGNSGWGGEGKTFALPPGQQSLHRAYTAMNLDDLSVMQFTGLHDKNGKEIYEGDLLRYDDWLWEVRWGNNKAAFYLCSRETDIRQDEHPNQHDARLSEVIGNIYENPELLSSPLVKGAGQ
jgi:hypothetical protein